MTESIRLIIWDLDETFWYGTLTEGGITIRPEVCQLVKDLAARGIMSSICSKNNLSDVKALLEQEGVWDYFIFPSVSWEPKGTRVAQMVDTVQLRPPTILFIDDNPMNLQEVRHFVPDIQVESKEFIPAIVAGQGLFVGKDDRELTRLRQYKLLEARKTGRKAAGIDNTGFLRSSDIRVEFERDVEKHIDRVVEIINRTNQLNFTKIRLPEDLAEARKQVLELLSKYNIQAALLKVRDRYGDHGFTGLYVMSSEDKRLLHFAFSCRILGMGVEQWLYNLLGRPHLEIKGEVLSNPKDTLRSIDWINASDAGAGAATENLSVEIIIAHGGCDLSAVGHYFGVHGVEVVSEFNIVRHGLGLRLDHSCFLRYGATGDLDEQRMEVARRMGYAHEDFRSAIFASPEKRHAVLVSFATDAHYALYRHRETGLVIPQSLDLGPVEADQRLLELPPERRTGCDLELHTALKTEFDYLGTTGEHEFKQNIRLAFGALSSATKIFVLRPCDYHLNKQNGDRYFDKKFVDLNRWTAETAAEFPNVTLLDIPDFVQDVLEIDNILHYDRKVYFRVYKRIVELLTEKVVDERDDISLSD